MADSSIKKWLKRIFSVTTLSVLVAIASLVVTYITYKSNTSGELTLEVKNKNVDILKQDGCRMTTIQYNYDSIAYPGQYMVYVKNESSRTVKDLYYSVCVIPHGKCLLYENEDFESHGDRIYNYKYDKFSAYKNTCSFGICYSIRKSFTFGGNI